MSGGHLLDTNYVSELVRVKPDPVASTWIDNADEASLYLSVLTLGEIRKGVAGLPGGSRRTQLETWLVTELPERFAKRILPVDTAIADRWGELAAEIKRSGTHMSTVDAILAATALHHGLVLVTRNVKDFQAAGVNILNPWETS